MYDLFVLHADVPAEASFVRRELVPAMGLAGERVLLSSELPLGKTIVGAIDEGVAKSRVTVAVVSPAFLRDQWAKFGEELASTLAVTGGTLVPLVLVDCALPLRLQARVPLDCRDPARRPAELVRLRKLLGASAPAPAPLDVFLACPSLGEAAKQALTHLLQPQVRVVPQRSARATGFLISAEIDLAWYLGDEVITAIRWHHAAPGAHALISLLLGPGVELPRALAAADVIDVAAVGGLAAAADQVRALAARTSAHPDAPPPASESARADWRGLHDRLTRVSDPAVFEAIVSRLDIDRRLVAPATASVTARALDLALLAAIDADLHTRILTQLDLRVPGTRRP